MLSEEDIKFLVFIETILISTIVLIFILAFGINFLLIGNNPIKYILNKSVCNVYVEGKKVYSGRTHFVEIGSLGVNGNTKSLTIYGDKWGLKVLKRYVSDDIKIIERED